jgi:ABC-type transport system involved in multi-copper enzyme maturation permease subunit
MSLEARDAGTAPAGAIADLSYRNYDGPLHSRALRWLTVARAVVRLNAGKKAFAIPALGVLLIYMLLGAKVYLEPNEGMGAMQASFMGYADEYTMTFHMATGMASFLVFLIAVVTGAGSIASDNRANALLIYLSKPITRTDYLLGKWMGVFTLTGAASCVPALALYVFFLGMFYKRNFFSNDPWLALKALAATALAAALHTSLIIGFSALNKKSRTAGVLYAGFYLLLSSIVVIVGALMLGRFEYDNRARLPHMEGRAMIVEPKGPDAEFLKKAQMELATVATVQSLDVGGVSNGVALHLYKANPPYHKLNELKLLPPLFPLLLLAGLFLTVPVLLAWYCIKAVEVVKG